MVVRLSYFDLFLDPPSLISCKCSHFIVAQSLIITIIRRGPTYKLPKSGVMALKCVARTPFRQHCLPYRYAS